MEVYEITGNSTGVSRAGVNFLQPGDSYQNMNNGYIYRQVLQSRQGSGYFAPRLNPTPVGVPPTVISGRRVFGIFEHTLPNSTKELLAVDQYFLYKFNTSTGVFDQIPFAGSMVNYSGFSISAKDFYVSGTSYPTATNGARFVFCGAGIAPNAAGSSIFFYNGTDVRDFTSAADNLNYANPSTGTLTSATFVIWFGERLNFFIPVISSIAYNQGILYSGIRTASGNGDKFNVAGSGLLQADTYENMTGVTILGQILALNFDRSNWTLEKTRDAFNPYFIRKVPSVEGTNANFSAVSWNKQVKSLGKTGVISTDGRESVKTDNKIPFFTQDDIDQKGFNLTYGGFDRQNNQFMWSYKKSGTVSDTQNSVLINNYEEETWSVYDQRFSVFGQTDVGLDLTWDEIEFVAGGNASWESWDTTEDIWDRIGLGAAVQKTLAGDDLGFIYELNLDFDDYFTAITSITSGVTTTVNVNATGILAGDYIVIENVAGMIEINNYDPATGTQNGNLYFVLSATPTAIEIDVDSRFFTPATPNTGSLSKTIVFSADTIPFNPYRSQGRQCFVSHVEFLIENNGGFLLVNVTANNETIPFKQNILCKPRADQIGTREWVTMSVNQEADFFTFGLKQQSPGVQFKLYSMRIHCDMGSMTAW